MSIRYFLSASLRALARLIEGDSMESRAGIICQRVDNGLGGNTLAINLLLASGFDEVSFSETTPNLPGNIGEWLTCEAYLTPDQMSLITNGVMFPNVAAYVAPAAFVCAETIDGNSVISTYGLTMSQPEIDGFLAFFSAYNEETIVADLAASTSAGMTRQAFLSACDAAFAPVNARIATAARAAAQAAKA